MMEDIDILEIWWSSLRYQEITSAEVAQSSIVGKAICQQQAE